MLLVLLSAILAVTAAQQNLADPIADFCRRHQHQTCIIDSKLYIDGGMVYYGGSVDNNTVAEQNTRLLWEDVLDTDNDYKFPTQYKNLTKDPEIPSVSGGVLWPDSANKLFYLFGGEYASTNDVQPFTTLWFYDIIYNTWNRSSASDGSQTRIAWPAFGAGTVTDIGTAYYYGGYLNNKSVSNWSGEPMMLNSLISFNMNTRSWTNHTYDQTPRAEGTLQFIPASAGGMLVYFGGVETNSSGGISYSNMSDIQLFDIADNKWLTQIATGDIPQPRRGSCAGVIWAKDQSSYNFYVYGGILANEEAVDELYVLSLPSFQWTLVYPASVPNYLGGKGWMSCDVIRQSQMILIGGQFTNASAPECDVPKIGGQHGLLLGQENVELGAWWHGIVDNTTGYRVPDQIVAHVGGDAEGHATATAPAQGFQSHDLSVYFKSTASAAPRTATRSIPATATARSTGQPKSKNNTGAIAGGVVGGVVGLAAIITLVFFCLRRRRRATKQSESGNTMAQDAVANYSAVPDGTQPAIAEAPAYSPGEQQYYHGASPHQQQAANWAQKGGYAYQQPQPSYYPSPSELGQSSGKQQSPHEMMGELPSTSTPAIAEMPDLSSPAPNRAS